jgi:hypothetical protein
MTHPLIGDLSTLSTDELNNRVNNLSKKLSQAHRMGSYDAIQQIRMFMDDYQFEIQNRHSKLLDETTAKHPEFSGIINIG